jgi:hypothetical protein
MESGAMKMGVTMSCSDEMIASIIRYRENRDANPTPDLAEMMYTANELWSSVMRVKKRS